MHWEDQDDEAGFQCSTCGKVFGSGNQTAYMKHLATHDDEVQRPCGCSVCLKEEGGKKGKKRKGTDLKTKDKRAKGDGGLVEAITKRFNETADAEENDIDNPDDVTEEDEGIAEVHTDFDDDEEPDTDSSKFSVNCGVCGVSFKDIDKLEEHLATGHGKEAAKQPLPFVARKGGWECHLCHSVMRTSRELKSHKANRECSVLRQSGSEAEEQDVPAEGGNTAASSTATSTAPATCSATSGGPAVRSNLTALWQQSESRNWAAEFGYGRGGAAGKEGEGGEGKEKGTARKSSPMDILSAMKMKFGGGEEEEDEDEDEEDETYLYGSKRTESRRESHGEPRVLTQASRQTR